MGSMNLTQMWEKLVCKDLMVEGGYIYPIYYLISQKYISYYNYISILYLRNLIIINIDIYIYIIIYYIYIY